MIRRLKQIFLACCFLSALFLAHFYGCTSYLSITWLQANVSYLEMAVRQHYWYVVLIYLAAYIAAASCALPGATFFIIASGLLFGFVPGIFFALIGLVIGATVSFLIARYIVGSWAQRRFSGAFLKCNRAIEKDGYYYMLCARMIAIVPFGILNVLAGVTLLPTRTFIWTTAAGMFPYVLLYVFAGQQLGTIQSTDTLFSSPLLLFFSTILFRVSIIPFLVRYLFKVRRKE